MASAGPARATAVGGALLVGLIAAAGVRAAGSRFVDVPAGHWAAADVRALAADGIVAGYPGGRFGGNRPLTRYEMGVLLARVAAKLEADAATAASKVALDRQQKQVGALTQRVAALDVRVAALEDAVRRIEDRGPAATLAGAALERSPGAAGGSRQPAPADSSFGHRWLDDERAPRGPLTRFAGAAILAGFLAQREAAVATTASTVDLTKLRAPLAALTGELRALDARARGVRVRLAALPPAPPH